MDALTEPAIAGGLPFTCLIPAWAGDHPAHFAEALASVARSRLRPTEVIIAQDGDVPLGLETAIREGIQAGARRVINPGSRGLHHNLNHALSAVRTPWVARFDADDLNLPDRFDQQTRFLRENPDIAVLGGAIVEFDEEGRERVKRMPLTHSDIVGEAAWRNPINHMTAFFRLEAVLEAGGYPDVPRKEDYALWLTLIARGRVFANLAPPLVRARLGGDFHARRSGLHNLASEMELFELKRRIGRIGLARALAASTARAGVLSAESAARFAYERVLRR